MKKKIFKKVIGMALAVAVAMSNAVIAVNAENDDTVINVKIDISSLYNRTAFNQDFWNGHYIKLDDFKAGNEAAGWTWKDAWTDETGNAITENTLQFNGKEYYMKNIAKDATVFFRNYDNGNKEVYNVDVEDGFYDSLSFLATTYYNPGYVPAKLAVRLNYRDKETEEPFVVKSVVHADDLDENVPYIDINTVYNSGSGSVENPTRFVREYTYDVNPNLVLESFDILPRDGILNEDGTLNAATGNTVNTTYQVSILGACAQTNAELMANFEKLTPVNVKVDISDRYNRKGFAGNDLWPGNHIDIDKFKAGTSQYSWKEEWVDGKTDNILVFNGKEYYISNIYEDATVFFRNHDNGNSSVYNVDVEDGYYNEVSILATDYYTGASADNMKLAVRFNYRNEEPGVFVTESLPKTGGTATNGFEVSTLKDGGTGVRYIGEYVFPTASDKVLESIDILPRDGEIDENGALVAATGKSKLYETIIYGISAQTNAELMANFEKLTPVNVKVDISDRYNRKGFAGNELWPGHHIDIDKFKAGTSQYSWKEEWVDGKSDNILVFNGKEYYISNIYEDATVFFRNHDNGNSSVYNVDVEDGYYNEVSILATDYYTGASADNMKLAVRFNYRNEEPGVFVTESLPKSGGTATNGFEVSTLKNGGTGVKYIGEYVFPTASDKVLESIDILPRDGEIDENGALVAATGKSKLYETTIYGIGAQTNGVLIENYKNISPVSRKVDISDRYNRKGFAGNDLWPGNHIDIDKFKAGTSEYSWKEEWVDGKTDNILVFNGKEYYISNIYEDATVFFRNHDNGNSSLYNVDVADGHYNEVTVLATDYYTGSSADNMKLAVRFNYRNEEPGVFVTESLPKNGGTATNGFKVSTLKDGGTGVRYIGEYVFQTASDKVLESIDILPRNGVLNDDGTLLAATSESKNYEANIFAISLRQTFADLKSDVIAIIDALPETITLEDKEAVYEVKAAVEEALSLGVTTDKITNYNKYLKAVKVLENYAEISSSEYTNDENTATLTITFKNAIKQDIYDSAVFTVMKESAETNIEAVKEAVVTDGKITGIKVTFAHNLDYDAEWAVKAVIGNTVNTNIRVVLDAAVELSEIVINNSEEGDLDNFYDANGSFSVSADISLNTSNDFVVLFGLYNADGALVQLKIAELDGGKIFTSFEDLEIMDENWTLKYIIWNSVDGMVPLTLASEI